MIPSFDYSWDGAFEGPGTSAGVADTSGASAPSSLHSPLSVPSPNPRLRNVTKNHTLASPLMESRLFERPKVAKPRRRHGNDIFTYVPAKAARPAAVSPRSKPPLKPSVTIASIDTIAEIQRSAAKRKDLGSVSPGEKKRKVSTSSSVASDSSSASDGSLFSQPADAGDPFSSLSDAGASSMSLVDYDLDVSFLEGLADDPYKDELRRDDFDPLKGFEDFIFYH